MIDIDRKIAELNSDKQTQSAFLWGAVVGAIITASIFLIGMNGGLL